ncbi:MAG: Npt1/Npt2 family nucleotide transporter [Vicinamibacterales bacterium]
MTQRLRRFLDVRPGEGLPVLLTFLYIAVVVASFLLAKPIRQGLVLREYGPYALVYLYAAVPLVLSLFVPVYARVAARFGARTVTVGTLIFFSVNAAMFWYAFRFRPFALLPGLFFIWVNCYGVIAPVQAWSFANSLFDTRQAKRLFGLIGSGASFGAISGGILARFLVEPVGGTVNLMLVLAVLLLVAAGIVTATNYRIRRLGLIRRGSPAARPYFETWREIASSPYLRLLAGLVFLSAIATQWTAFQLNVIADIRFAGDLDSLTRFFGTFNFLLGIVSFLLQLLITGRLLRTFGVAATILALPLALSTGNLFIALVPAFWSVLLTNAFDQGLRFSVDKATYELLYLPISHARRAQVKSAIDIVVNRVADAVGAVLLGLATGGFLMLPGFHVGIRGTAALNLITLSIWLLVAWRLRTEYVRTIQDSIHRHRLDSERSSGAVTERTAADVLRAKLAGSDPSEIRYALDLLEGQRTRRWQPALRDLLSHPDADIRRRALALLSAAGDAAIAERVPAMLRDPDLGVRTEALLYLSRESGIDPLRQIEQLGDFEDFSIRAGTAAFLAAPGRSHNLEAARVILDAMAATPGPEGRRDRAEAARLIGAIGAPGLLDLLPGLIADEDVEVAREGVRAADRTPREELVPSLLDALGRSELADEAADALARLGDIVVPQLSAALRADDVSVEVRRELPSVLLRIGSDEAERALVDSLLEADGTVRHRVIASLNKLRAARPDIRIDPKVVELLLAAEIAGHYRSYQVLGPLQAQLKEDDPVLEALRHSMEQELERIFRLMALLFPQTGLHDAYVGVRSSNPAVRANALEFLDNVLEPELWNVLVPVLDSQVTVAERIDLANRLVGAPLENAQQAVATLLASDDPWLRSCAIGAVATLQLRSLAPELRRYESSPDPLVRQSVADARARLAGESRALMEPQVPAPAGLNAGVGVG